MSGPRGYRDPHTLSYTPYFAYVEPNPLRRGREAANRAREQLYGTPLVNLIRPPQGVTAARRPRARGVASDPPPTFNIHGEVSALRRETEQLRAREDGRRALEDALTAGASAGHAFWQEQERAERREYHRREAEEHRQYLERERLRREKNAADARAAASAAELRNMIIARGLLPAAAAAAPLPAAAAAPPVAAYAPVHQGAQDEKIPLVAKAGMAALTAAIVKYGMYDQISCVPAYNSGRLSQRFGSFRYGDKVCGIQVLPTCLDKEHPFYTPRCLPPVDENEPPPPPPPGTNKPEFSDFGTDDRHIPQVGKSWPDWPKDMPSKFKDSVKTCPGFLTKFKVGSKKDYRDAMRKVHPDKAADEGHLRELSQSFGVAMKDLTGEVLTKLTAFLNDCWQTDSLSASHGGTRRHRKRGRGSKPTRIAGKRRV